MSLMRTGSIVVILSAAGARFSTQCRPAFTNQKWSSCQRRNRVEPCNVEECVDGQARQRNRGQIRTHGRLRRIRSQRHILAAACFPALQRGQNGHSNQGGEGDSDSQAAWLWPKPTQKRDKRSSTDDRREEKKPHHLSMSDLPFRRRGRSSVGVNQNAIFSRKDAEAQRTRGKSLAAWRLCVNCFLLLTSRTLLRARRIAC